MLHTVLDDALIELDIFFSLYAAEFQPKTIPEARRGLDDVLPVLADERELEGSVFRVYENLAFRKAVFESEMEEF